MAREHGHGESSHGRLRVRSGLPLQLFRNVLPQELEGPPFLFATGLLYRRGQPAEFTVNGTGFHNANSGGQDSRFDYRVLRTVEAEEVAEPTAVDHFDDDVCSFLEIV